MAQVLSVVINEQQTDRNTPFPKSGAPIYVQQLSTNCYEQDQIENEAKHTRTAQHQRGSVLAQRPTVLLRLRHQLTSFGTHYPRASCSHRLPLETPQITLF